MNKKKLVSKAVLILSIPMLITSVQGFTPAFAKEESAELTLAEEKATEVRYKVITRLENPRDEKYAFEEVMDNQGKPGELVTQYGIPSYTGFELSDNSKQSKVPSKDNGFVNLYYKRKLYDLTLMKKEGDKWDKAHTNKIRYGDSLDEEIHKVLDKVENPVVGENQNLADGFYTGYPKMPAKDLTLYIQKGGDIEYKVSYTDKRGEELHPDTIFYSDLNTILLGGSDEIEIDGYTPVRNQSVALQNSNDHTGTLKYDYKKYDVSFIDPFGEGKTIEMPFDDVITTDNSRSGFVSGVSTKYVNGTKYVFDGRYENSDYSGKKFEYRKVPAHNLVFFAKWVPVKEDAKAEDGLEPNDDSDVSPNLDIIPDPKEDRPEPHGPLAPEGGDTQKDSEDSKMPEEPKDNTEVSPSGSDNNETPQDDSIIPEEIPKVPKEDEFLNDDPEGNADENISDSKEDDINSEESSEENIPIVPEVNSEKEDENSNNTESPELEPKEDSKAENGSEPNDTSIIDDGIDYGNNGKIHSVEVIEPSMKIEFDKEKSFKLVFKDKDDNLLEIKDILINVMDIKDPDMKDTMGKYLDGAQGNIDETKLDLYIYPKDRADKDNYKVNPGYYTVIIDINLGNKNYKRFELKIRLFNEESSLVALSPSTPKNKEESKDDIPWTDLVPANPIEKEKESIPWIELIPSTPIEKEEEKETIPWIELTPSTPIEKEEKKETIPWVELTPAEPIEKEEEKEIIPRIELSPSTPIEKEEKKDAVPWVELSSSTHIGKENKKESMPRTELIPIRPIVEAKSNNEKNKLTNTDVKESDQQNIGMVKISDINPKTGDTGSTHTLPVLLITLSSLIFTFRKKK